MKRNLNKTFAYIWVMTLVMMGGPAFGQRDNGGGNGGNATTQHVEVRGNVYGGGNLAPVAGNTSVLVDQQGCTIGTVSGGVHAGGDVYGGGALADVGTLDGGNTTTVNILNGIINGNVYGGGLGKLVPEVDTIAAKVYGKVYVNIGAKVNNTLTGNASFSVSDDLGYGNVFGCNNICGTPLDSVFVNIYKTKHTTGDLAESNAYPTSITTMDALFAAPNSNANYAIKAVYGGGNMASYEPELNAGDTPKCATVHVWDCQENTIQTIYGGGNAADAGTAAKPADTRLILDGGRFDRVFGGGNGYSASGNHTLPYYDGSDCSTTVSDTRCPDYNPGANIFGKASTYVYGGLYRQIFGGSNQYGDIGTVALAIQKNCDNLLIEECFGGGNEAVISSNVETSLLCSTGSGDYHIGNFYGGSNMADIRGNVTLNVYGGTYTNVFGGSKGVGGTTNPVAANIVDNPNTTDVVEGNVTLNLHGGTMVNAFGGSDANGNISGIITVNLLQDGDCPLVIDTIYGAGQDAAYTPETVNGKKIVSPVVNLWHGQVGEKNDGNVVTVPGCVFGGGKGNGAVVTAHPKVNIGDIEHEGNSNQITVLGHVFGGGNAAGVDGIDSVLMLKANSEVVNLFGGGNKAAADSTVVMMTAGAAVDTIFGGGNLAGLSGAALVEVSAGTSRGGVYGGSNKSGNVVGDIAVNVTGGMVGTEDTQTANIHGGGYGTSTSTEGNVEVNIGAAPVAPSTTPTGDAVIWGDVYGGSADGSVNNDGSDHTWVTLYGGTINGSLYGGGLGIENDDCNVNGAVKVTVEGGYVNKITNSSRTTGSVFGCNNAKGSPKSIVEVKINSTAPSSGSGNSKVYALQGVYGGGNLAAYVPTTTSADYPKVTVNGCASSIKDVYGGGNAAPVPNAKVVINGGDISRVFAGGNGESGTPAHIGWNNTDANPSTDDYGTGKATAEIKGGTILQVFGGSNANGVIRVSSSLDINKSTASGACPMKLGEVYGGGNEANGNAGTIAIGCTGDWTTGDGNTHEHHNSTGNRIGYELEGIGTVYGGANAADVTGNITLNITSGIVENVFGGNNNSGEIGGNITVNINKNNAACDWYVGNVYGGGNQAPYKPTTPGAYPAVNIKNGTVSQNVFGGGLGATAKVYSNPVVTVGDVNPDHSAYQAVVLGNVHGGGSAAMVGDGGETPSICNTTVTLQKANSSVAKLFGGGMAAGVTGTTTVNVNNGTVSAGAYGGCDASGVVGGNIAVNVTGGTVGTNDAVSEDGVFGGGFGNGTSTSGNVTVAISGGNVYGDVYGGSAKGSVNDASSDQTTVTLTSGTIHGDLYGGGLGDADNAAAVNGAVTVNVNGGTVTNVFGCNNVNGAPQSSVQVNINQTGSSMTVNDVYGGGNHAAYSGTPSVNIMNGTVSGSVFGGGNDITLDSSSEPLGVAGSNVEMTGGIVLGGVYGGCNEKGTVTEDSEVKIYGGTIGSQSNLNNGTTANVFGGGLGADTKVSGNVTVNIGNTSTGPTLYGDVYGGSAKGSVNDASSDQTTVTLTSGTIHGDLYGGGLGDADNAAAVNGAVTVNVNGGTVTNVFGCNNVNGAPQSTVQVNIHETTENTMSVTNVYGGGNQAAYSGSPVVNIQAGTVSRNVYGGGNDITTENAGILNSDVEMTGGIVLGGIYGGCNLNGYVTGNSVVNILGGIVGSSSQLDDNTVANVFGGGLGADTKVSGNVTVNIGNTSTGPTLYGDVYGGSALGSVNSVSSNTTTVNILNGTLVAKTTNANGFTSYTGGNVFGGGLGEANNTFKGKVNGKVVVNIGSGTPDATSPFTVAVTDLSGNATIGGNVYGCNNSGGSPQDDVTVNIFQTAHTEGNAYGAVAVPGDDISTYAIANVFGGGNEADFSPASTSAKTYVNVYTCVNTIRRVFGGGNAAATPEVVTHIQGGRFFQVFGGGNGERGDSFGADVHGDVRLNLHGGNIGEYYGGSNQNGTISGGIFTEVLNDSPCPSVVIEDFFCGGNFVTIYGDLVTTIACSDGRFTNLYGGCNQANIYGNVVLNLEGGTYTNVFGGSKGVANGVSADILAVTDEVHTAHPDLVVGHGGNVTLNLHGGKIDNVFGGSNINGNIQGTITVNVLDKENSVCPLVITNIYGGSNLTHYQPADPNAISPVVNVVHALRGIAGNVYGGSKGAEGATGDAVTTVKANPLVNIGYESGMTGLPETTAYDPDSYSRKTTIQGNVFGGGDAAKVEGNTEIRLNKGTKVIGNVYGGGNMGEVDGDTKVIVNGKRL